MPQVFIASQTGQAQSEFLVNHSEHTKFKMSKFSTRSKQFRILTKIISCVDMQSDVASYCSPEMWGVKTNLQWEVWTWHFQHFWRQGKIHLQWRLHLVWIARKGVSGRWILEWATSDLWDSRWVDPVMEINKFMFLMLRSWFKMYSMLVQ